MRVAVIGGGVAGLSAGLALLERGAEPVIFEASHRAGGKVGSAHEKGFLTEDGPHFMAKPLDRLLAQTGLTEDVVTAQKPHTRWVHLAGRVLKAPSFGLLARVNVPRALMEPIVARKLNGDVPILDLMTARLGKRAGTLAATLMSAGIYAGDPAKLSTRAAFPAVAAMAEQGSLIGAAFRKPKTPRTPLWSLREGLGSLAAKAAEKLGARVRTGVRIDVLTPAPNGWRILGDTYDAVILAVPSSKAAALLDDRAPAFGHAIGELTYASVGVVHLGLPADEVPRGFGVLDADGSLTGIGTLFPSSMLPGRAPEGRALVSAIVGGVAHPERLQQTDAELAQHVASDLRRLLGVRSEPDYVRVVRHKEAIPQYAPGHADRVRAAREALQGLPPIAVAGASYDGVGVADVARSGQLAAERVCPTSQQG